MHGWQVSFAGALLLGHALVQARPVVLTEDLPPLQVISKGKVVSGVAYQRAQQILTLANVTAKPQVLPWARLYKWLETEPDVLAFSLVRTPEREAKFIWVAPLFHMELSVYSLAARNLTATSIEELKAGITGVKRDDVVAHYLLQRDFEFGDTLLEVKDTTDTFKLLLKQRVDYIPATPLVIQAVCKTIGCKAEDFKLNFTIHDLPQDFYLAASLGTSAELIARLQQAAASLIETVPEIN